ncbi:MAG TPA: 50S ribosomal protein L4 [Candidatus Paceibacterota bacterium]|nr:50S ribosomal protein L4 [Candidatus Paceibacterota bacterium]
MKASLINIEGKKVKEIDLPKIFSNSVREDIIKKVFESEKRIQPYAPDLLAGRKHSASGRIRHIRHKWRSAYGRGISRVPRKTMWRRGTQFYWIGAESSGTRSGRRSHPPRVEHFSKEMRINKKEYNIAISSVISSTLKKEYINKRYQTLNQKKIELDLPLIIESNSMKVKTKEFLIGIQKILGELFEISQKKKAIRAGKGKQRNRRYKETAGLLLIIGNEEIVKHNKIEIKRVKDLEIKDFWPLGRIIVYTEKSIEDLKKMEKEND